MATRLVNAQVLYENFTDFGTSYFTAPGGAWGIPAEAISYARTLRSTECRRVAGVRIVDVGTGEMWAVPA